MFSKEPVDSEIIEVPSTTVEDVNDVVVDELTKRGLPPDIVNRVSLELKKNEDYTSNVSMTRTVEELPDVITALIDIIKEKDGKPKTLTDERGIMLDVLGAKGNIPISDQKYHRRANISAVVTGLIDDVYHVEYEVDPDTKQIIFDKITGLPTITKRYPVNIGIAKRNLDGINNLAFDANTRNTQARIFGAWGGGTGLGIDGRFETLMGGMFGEGKRSKK